MPAIPPPVIPSAEDLYESLMQRIEPELTHDQIPLLDEKYKEETEEQKAARQGRYQRAFAEYDKALEAYMKDLNAHVAVYRKQALKEAETQSAQQEADALSQMESRFQ